MTKKAQKNLTVLPKTSLERRRAVMMLVFAFVVFVAGVLVGSFGMVGGKIRNLAYGVTESLDLTTTQEINAILQRDFDGALSRSGLEHGANSGLVAATGDRFSAYLTPNEWETFKQRMQGSTIGIGVELGFKGGNLVIIAPQDGSPAKQAGLRAGDIIIEINGGLVQEMSEQEAVQALRGKAGTVVELRVLRDGQQKNFSVTRQPIVIPSVRASITQDNIGVMHITTFDSNTTRLAVAAATNFRDKKVRGIVLDMRDNPGGAVTAARDVAGLWLPKGSVVLTEKRGSTVLRTYRTLSDALVADIPTVVLLNGGSASASEVVAGALHDYAKASIIGTQSFGKGSVQEVRTLRNGGALSFTVSRWTTPNGRMIDGVGISPDHVISLTDEDAANGRDTQMSAALTTFVH